MSENDKIHYVDCHKLRAFATEALTKVDVPREDAAIIAMRPLLPTPLLRLT